MNLKNKNTQVTLFLILVIIIVTCFACIKILAAIKENIEIENVLAENISNTQWPAEIPIIKTKYFSIERVGDSSWNVNIQEYIDYADFREYLIELYAEGFMPLTEFGSQNPKLLSINEPTGDDAFVTWIGEKGKYTVEVYWDNTMMYLNSDQTQDYFEQMNIVLYSNEDIIPVDDNSLSDISGDVNFNISGDISGDALIELSGDFSGDAVLENSGDISGDAVNEISGDDSKDTKVVSGD